MLEVCYQYTGVHRRRSGEDKEIRWNWDGIRPGEACWVLRTAIGALGDTGPKKMENRMLGRSGHTGRRGRTQRIMRT